MLLSGVLFVVFSAGCWLYCLTDAALMPGWAFPGWRKRTWMAFIAVTFVVGAVGWVLARRRWRFGQWPPAVAYHVSMTGHDDPPPPASRQPHVGVAIADAVARHPATRSRNPDRPDSPALAGPIGPEDDEDFIRMLAERIHGTD